MHRPPKELKTRCISIRVDAVTQQYGGTVMGLEDMAVAKIGSEANHPILCGARYRGRLLAHSLTGNAHVN